MAVLSYRRPFTVAECHAMGDAGVISPTERVELVDGEILTMPPTGPRHAGDITRLAYWLIAAFGNRAIVRTQNPVRLDGYSEPEPDIALLRPRDNFCASRHPQPSDVFALIEVAETSLAYDRGKKLRAYARHALAEYWVIDLRLDQVLVHRDPSETGYAFERIAGRGEILGFAAFPHDAFRVDDLLPEALD